MKRKRRARSAKLAHGKATASRPRFLKKKAIRKTTGAKKGRARTRTPRPVRSVTSAFERMLQTAALTPQQYVLRLYVTGTTPKSSRAIQNIRALCDRHLEGRYDLEVIDIYQQPTLASVDQIIAAPTLIRKLPAPLRKVIGDLSDEQQVLMGLDLSPRADHDGGAAAGSSGG